MIPMYVITAVFVFFSITNQCLSTTSYYVQLNDVDLNSCSNANYVFNILSFNFWSDSLEIPGDLGAILSFRLDRDYSAQYTTYSFKLERKLGPLWIDLPCITDQCGDQSFCTFMKASCSVKKFCKNNCQIPAGSHTLDMIRIPVKSSFFGSETLTTGQYRFKIRLYDERKATIGCFDGYMTLKKPQNIY